MPHPEANYDFGSLSSRNKQDLIVLLLNLPRQFIPFFGNALCEVVTRFVECETLTSDFVTVCGDADYGWLLIHFHVRIFLLTYQVDTLDCF